MDEEPRPKKKRRRMGPGRFQIPNGPKREQFDLLWRKRRHHLEQAMQLRVQMTALQIGKITSVDDVLNTIRGRRRRKWFQLLLSFMSKGAPMDNSLDSATRLSYGNLAVANDKSVMAKAMANLNQPDICAAVQSIYELRGFTMTDGVDMHIAHIKGEIKKDVVVKVRDAEGNESVEVEQVRMAPSYQALKDFQAMIIPKQTTKVAVASFNMNAMMSEIQEEGFTPLEARIVGEVMDTDPEVDPDDVDPFDKDEDNDDDE